MSVTGKGATQAHQVLGLGSHSPGGGPCRGLGLGTRRARPWPTAGRSRGGLALTAALSGPAAFWTCSQQLPSVLGLPGPQGCAKDEQTQGAWKPVRPASGWGSSERLAWPPRPRPAAPSLQLPVPGYLCTGGLGPALAESPGKQGCARPSPGGRPPCPSSPRAPACPARGSWRPHAPLGVTTGPSLPAPLAVQMEPLPCLPGGQSAPHPRPSLEARGRSVGSPTLASQTLGSKPGAHFPTPGRLKSGPHLITS